MFGFFKKKPKEHLDELEQDLIRELKVCPPATEEYEAMVKNLETVEKAKSYNKRNWDWLKFAAPIIATIIGGIITDRQVNRILEYEEEDALTTKATGFMWKNKY